MLSCSPARIRQAAACHAYRAVLTSRVRPLDFDSKRNGLRFRAPASRKFHQAWARSSDPIWPAVRTDRADSMPTREVMMRAFSIFCTTLLAALLITVAVRAGGDNVKFPVNYAKGVLYTTVDRPDNKQYRE